jgi:predicted RNA polymerase sigma factor
MVREGTAVSEHGSMEFEPFARAARPRLVRALAPVRGEEAADGAAEALAYAWEHWDRVGAMGNPIGYLYRVAHASQTDAGASAT